MEEAFDLDVLLLDDFAEVAFLVDFFLDLPAVDFVADFFDLSVESMAAAAVLVETSKKAISNSADKAELKTSERENAGRKFVG